MSPTKQFHKVGLSQADVFPYLMLQGEMVSNNESKVVCDGGKALYMSSISKKGISPNGANGVSKQALFTFAENALLSLKAADSSFCMDSITRVDIFQTSKGKLVVNEFESLDANYSVLYSILTV